MKQFDSPTSFTDTGEIIKKTYHYGPCDGSSEAPAFYRVTAQNTTGESGYLNTIKVCVEANY